MEGLLGDPAGPGSPQLGGDEFDTKTHTFSELFHNCVYMGTVAIFLYFAYLNNVFLAKRKRLIALEKKDILDAAMEQLRADGQIANTTMSVPDIPTGSSVNGTEGTDADADAEGIPLLSHYQIESLVFNSNANEVLRPGQSVGISSPHKLVNNTLEVNVMETQRRGTLAVAGLHILILICSAVWMWAVVFGSKYWHTALQAVTHVVFWGVSFGMHIRCFINHVPTPACLEAFWVLIFLVNSLICYDIMRNGYPDLPSTLQIVAYWSSYCCSGFVAALGVYQVYCERSAALYETNAEVMLLLAFRARVEAFVNSGQYAFLDATGAWDDDELARGLSPGSPTMIPAVPFMHVATPRRPGSQGSGAGGTEPYGRLSPHERTLASERFGERLTVPTVASMLLTLSFKVEGVMLTFGILGAATAAAGFALLPVVLGTILNHIARSYYHRGSDQDNDLRELHTVSWQIMWPLVLITVGKFCANIFIRIAGSRLSCRIHRILFVAMTQQDEGYLATQSTPKLRRVLRSVDSLRHGMTTSLADVIGGMLQLLLCVIFMLVVTTGSIYDQIDETTAGADLLGIICAISVPAIISVAVLQWDEATLGKRHEDASEHAFDVAADVIDQIGLGGRDGLGPDINAAEARFDGPARSAMAISLRRDVLRSIAMTWIYLSFISAFAGLHYFGGDSAIRYRLTFKYVMSFIGLMLQMANGFGQIYDALPGLVKAIRAARPIFRIILRHPFNDDLGVAASLADRSPVHE